MAIVAIGSHQAAALASGQSLEGPSVPPPKLRVERYIPIPDFKPEALSKTVTEYEVHEPYIKGAVEWLAFTDAGFQRLADARMSLFEEVADENTPLTKGQALVKLGEAASKFQDQVTTRYDNTRKDLTAKIDHIETQYKAQLTKAVADPQSYGILAYIKALPSDKRTAFVHDAINKGDARTVEVVLASPPYLVDMSDDFHATLKAAWHAKSQPELNARLRALNKARDYLDGRAPRVFGEITRGVGVDWFTVAKLKSARNKSEELLALINAPKVD